MHFTELNDPSHGWSKHNYHERFALGHDTVCDNVERVDASVVSTEEFQERCVPRWDFMLACWKLPYNIFKLIQEETCFYTR